MRENLTYGLMRRARGPRPNDRDSKVENPEQTMVTALETCPLLYGENLLAYGLLMVGLSTVVVGLGKLIHGPLVPAPSLLWMTFSMFSFTAIGFSLAWYSFFQQKETAYTILVGVVTLMVMLGGLMWPVEAMPGFFQRFARLLPTYWLGDALRLSASNASFVDFLLPWGMQGLFAVAFLVMGSMRRLRG